MLGRVGGDERRTGGEGSSRDDGDVEFRDRAVVRAGTSDLKVGTQVRAGDKGLELDRRARDGREVLGEKKLDLLVTCDPPKWPGGAQVVVPHDVGKRAVRAGVPLAWAEGPDVQASSHLGR